MSTDGQSLIGRPESRSGPLAGVTVLDLSRLLPGPFASLLLSDMGARVIKINDRKQSDYLRHLPPLADDGISCAYHAINRGKEESALNLRDPKDRAFFLELVRIADVVIESFRPGALERLGLDFETLKKANPQILLVRLSGFGQTGPARLRAGHDLNYLARSGALSLTKTPTLPPAQIADLAGGAWPAAFQIASHLVQKARAPNDFVARTIDVSMSEGALALLQLPMATALNSSEEVTKGRDLLFGSAPCYEIYQTPNGHLALGAIEPKFWATFCELINAPELLSAQFDENARGQIQAHLSTLSDDIYAALLAHDDLCAEAVVELEEVEQDAHFVERGVIVTLSNGVRVVRLGLDIEANRDVVRPHS